MKTAINLSVLEQAIKPKSAVDTDILEKALRPEEKGEKATRLQKILSHRFDVTVRLHDDRLAEHDHQARRCARKSSTWP